jgi:zinc protease
MLLAFLLLGGVQSLAQQGGTSHNPPVKTNSSFVKSMSGETQTVFDPDKHDWPHSISDLKPDPRLVFGRLENGLRYVILPAPDQQGRVSMRLQFNVGANDEIPEQYGIAHFVEHMAFRGFKDTKSQELVKSLQRLGLTFGPDVNAFTSYETTIYNFDFPNNSKKNIKTGLKLFDDISRGLAMSETIFDTERNVVIAELGMRDTPKSRALNAKIGFMFPEIARYQAGIGGTEQTLNALKIEDLRTFYTAHYQPNKAIIVISGGVEAKMVEKIIRKQFGGWTTINTQEQKQTRDNSNKPKVVADTFKAYKERNLASQLDIVIDLPYSERPASLDYQKTLLLRKGTMDMLWQRLRPEAAKDGKLTWVRFSHGSQKQKDQVIVSTGAKNYFDALEYIDTERRRAVEFGFTQPEIDRMLRVSRQRLANRVLTKKAIDAPAEAGEIISSYNLGRVKQSARQKLDLFDTLSQEINPSDFWEEFKLAWSGEAQRIWIQSSRDFSGLEAKFSEKLATARTNKMEAYKMPEQVDFQVAGISPPGNIRMRTPSDKFGIERIVFENGAKLNIKKTGFKENQIAVKISVGGGFLALTKEDPNLLVLAKAMNKADHKNFTLEEIARFYEGKNITFSISILGDHMLFSNDNLTPTDIDSFFEVFTAFLLNVDYLDEQYSEHARLVDARTRRSAKTNPLVNNALYLNKSLYSWNDRFLGTKKANVSIKTRKSLEETLKPFLTSGPIEIGVSGDFASEELIKTITNTIGALPKREEKFIPTPVSSTEFVFTKEKTKNIYISAKGEQVGFHMCWPVALEYSKQEFERLIVLSRVLQIKTSASVREDLGKVYSPQIRLQFKKIFDKNGYLCSGVQVDEGDLFAVQDAVKAVGQSLFNGDISADELKRAKMPYLGEIQKAAKNNGFLSFQLAQAQSRKSETELYFGSYNRVKAVNRTTLIEHAHTIFDPKKLVLVRTIKKKNRKAIKFNEMLKSAKEGDVTAQEELAIAYLYGRDTDKDPKRAVEWLKTAAKGNSAAANLMLAEIYAKGKIAEKDRAKEIAHLKAGSSLGNKKAQFLLARNYEKKFQEFPDVTNEEIIGLYTKSAQQGYISAQYNLARHLVQGSMVQRDKKEAMVWLVVADKMRNITGDSKPLSRLKTELSEDEQKQARAQADKWLEAYMGEGSMREDSATQEK